MIESYVLLGTLGVHSIEDIKRKKITVSITLFSAILCILLHLLFRNESIYSMLAGMLSGTVIVLLSKLSKGRISMGDGVVLMLTGLYLGFWENLCLMFLAFSLASIWGIYQLLVRHKSKDERMAFVPFLFVGYVLLVLGKGAGVICV
ncbi:MAG: prepilin peptidase [Lachnospiraceae bacterium]|nr:prepilin peptidase [Lachnospiraceae bacterium]